MNEYSYKELPVDVLEALNNFRQQLGLLARETGSLYVSTWEDGKQLELRLDILDEQLSALRVGLESDIKGHI